MKTIRELREARGWSQVDLAHHVGVSPSTVYNWERDRAEPRLVQFKQLAMLFGVAMEEIVIPEVATKKLVAA